MKNNNKKMELFKLLKLSKKKVKAIKGGTGERLDTIVVEDIWAG